MIMSNSRCDYSHSIAALASAVGQFRLICPKRFLGSHASTKNMKQKMGKRRASKRKINEIPEIHIDVAELTKPLKQAVSLFN